MYLILYSLLKKSLLALDEQPIDLLCWFNQTFIIIPIKNCYIFTASVKKQYLECLTISVIEACHNYANSGLSVHYSVPEQAKDIYQGWPTSQRPRTTFLTVFLQRATSYTPANVNITLSLPHSHAYLCSVRFIVNVTHQHDRILQTIYCYASYLVGLLIKTKSHMKLGKLLRVGCPWYIQSTLHNWTIFNQTTTGRKRRNMIPYLCLRLHIVKPCTALQCSKNILSNKDPRKTTNKHWDVCVVETLWEMAVKA